MMMGRIGILMGGPSSEHEVSLASGEAVYNSLEAAGADVQRIIIPRDCDEPSKIRILIQEAYIDIAFIALHGRVGEDGAIQGLLDGLSIPYTSSGAEASRLAFDKFKTKLALRDAGMMVPEDIGGLGQEGLSAVDFPLVVKPVHEGSSIGLSIVNGPSEFASAVSLARSYDSEIIVERYIEGRELTVGILDEEPLPPIQILTKTRFYDYSAKYSRDDTVYLCPAPVTEEELGRLKDAAIEAHTALGCELISRTDMILDKRGGIWVLEVNTVPGFTVKSLVPKAARAKGLNFRKLCVHLVDLAVERARQMRAYSHMFDIGTPMEIDNA